MISDEPHAAEREAAERWFVRHGLPWFVDDVRADVARRLSGSTAVLAALCALGIGGAVAGTVVALGDPSFAPAAGVTIALVVAVGYAAFALHALPIAGWALRRAVRSLGLLFPLATRALPVLLLFITFLFINTEVWQVASALRGGVLWGAVLFFGAAALGFLVPRLHTELDEYDDRIQVDEVVAGTRGTPLEQVGHDLCAAEVDLPAQAQVRGLQLVNLVLVLVIAQAVQVLLLAVAVFVFFVVFGTVVIDESVITSWVGGDAPTYPPGPDLASNELLHVSVFLAAFSGFYFTVVAITDELYRREFFTSIMDELARAVSVRVIYQLLGRRPGDTD